MVVIDVAGGPHGGAARYAGELYRYLAQTSSEAVRVIGRDKRVTIGWLGRRELAAKGGTRKVAVNNVSFIAQGGERWTLLANALHFLTARECWELGRSVPGSVHAQAIAVRLAAQRSDVLVVPCTAMADRVARAVPALRPRLVVKLHPVSADSIPGSEERRPAILCPVVFYPYKRIEQRLMEIVEALDAHGDPAVQLWVTADREQLPPLLAGHPRVVPLGMLSHAELRMHWARSRAIYFPTGIESFGYPLAEARVSGHPVIALDTAQNQEIAGAALCRYAASDPDSLAEAVRRALTERVIADAGPFDPTAYFSWLPRELRVTNRLRSAIVLGGSGFVGSVCMAALNDAGWAVHAVPAPRLHTAARTVPGLMTDLADRESTIEYLARLLDSADVVVNAAGMPTITAAASDGLFGANSLLPGVLSASARRAGVRRLIHLSSVSVQGRMDPLDETMNHSINSAYSESRSLGERVLIESGHDLAVILRIPSVQGSRTLGNQMLHRIARSSLSSTVRGAQPRPIVLPENVGAAVEFLASYGGGVPPVVLTPAEGITNERLLEVLGDRKCLHIPARFARSLTSVLLLVGRRSTIAYTIGRGLELLWLGQGQTQSWLTTAGFVQPLDIEEWASRQRTGEHT